MNYTMQDALEGKSIPDELLPLVSVVTLTTVAEYLRQSLEEMGRIHDQMVERIKAAREMSRPDVNSVLDSMQPSVDLFEKAMLDSSDDLDRYEAELKRRRA